MTLELLESISEISTAKVSMQLEAIREINVDKSI